MAAEKECMIIGASPVESPKIFQEFDPKNYYVICADAGYETALRFGIVPDLVVGDFDSALKKPPAEIRTVSIPVEKDVTDTMYAAIRGLAKGFRSFVLTGCLGGPRFDHSLANLNVLLYLLEHGARGVIADETTRVFLLREGRLRMTDVRGATVSVFPFGNASCVVSYTGLKYPLDHYELSCSGLVMGVSNSVVKDAAEIRVHTGCALVTIYQP